MTKKTDSDKFSVTKIALLPGVLFALFVRWCVAAYPYSGYKKPPTFGDYEAQRHWQEITVHTPSYKWYYNTTQNDLQYWGLDYPALTAYHSFIMGIVADWLDPESVRLFASRGYESDSHKIFMRWTVFLCDVYFYVTAVVFHALDAERVKSKEEKNIFKRMDIASILMLLYPGLILIDHGHFQYNCVSLGLFLWATFFITAIENDIVSTIFFMLALNYKQMELYHALPFFFYLLRKCFIGIPRRGMFGYDIVAIINNINKLAIAVISLFIIIWFSIIRTWDDLKQVIFRLFPVYRGVFEDKVSNVWCFVNVFIKLKSIYSNEQMARLCLLCTGVAVLPSCLDLFFRINKKKFVLSLINVSLAFFLFSFHVHEKTILLSAIPVLLHFAEDPFMCFWFLVVSNFSMLPLLLKDGLLIPYVATSIIYLCFYSISLKLSQNNIGFFSFLKANKVYNTIQPIKIENPMLWNLVSINFILSLICMILLSLGSVVVVPPVKYPDLFPLVVSVFSCIHFLFFFLYFNYQQFSISTSLPKIQKIKTK